MCFTSSQEFNSLVANSAELDGNNESNSSTERSNKVNDITRQRWSATRLGERNSDVKPTTRRFRCYRPSLLGRDGWTSAVKGGASLGALYSN